MLTNTIQFDDGDVRASIVVRKAGIIEQVVHEQLEVQAREASIGEPGLAVDEAELEAGPESELRRLRANAEMIAHAVATLLWWPAAMAATVSAEIQADGIIINWPISLEAFLDLPPDLLDQWVRACWKLNPGWEPRPTGAAEEKKAAAPPAS